MIQGNWPLGAKAIALTLNGSAVSEEILSLTYTDDLNGSSETVLLGSTCAAQLTMVIDHPQNEFDGGEITVSIGGVPLGRFTVCRTRKRDGRLTLEAADAMCGDAMADPYGPQSQTGTALGVIREIASGAGLELADLTGITDVSVEGLGAGLTRREMLGRMAAVLGYHAHIDRAGKLALRWYADSGMEIGPDDYYAGGLNKQDADFVIGKIECTVSKLTTDADTDMERSETEILTAGEGSTGISISCPYMTQSALDSIFDRIGGLTYRPMTVELFGDCRIETGNLLTVEDLAGDSFSVPVMSVSHVWDGGVRTIITASGPEPIALSAGGTLSEGLKRLEAEVGRFRNLVADYARLTKADIQELFADWANIGTAIIDTLIAEGISAQWMKVTDSSGNVIFSADQDSHSVKIGGWTATKDKLSSSGGGNTIALGSGQITANVIKLENSSSTDQMPTMSFYPRNGSNSMLDISAYGSSTAGYSSQLYSPTDLILRSPTGIILIAGTSQGPSGYGGVGIEGELYINGVKLSTTLSGKAPTSHAVDANTYGLGTTARYGHVKTVNNVTTSAHANGLALSAYQGKVLKDAIDALSSRTDSTITVASGWTATQKWCRKRAGIVEFYLEITGGTLSSGWNTVGTLPSGYRPPAAFDDVVLNNGSTTDPAAQMKVQADGSIRVYKVAATTNNLRLRAVFST